MISNRNLVMLFHLFICIHINYVNGYSCFDGSNSEDCECSTGTSGAIGTCICSETSVRQGQPCAYDLVNAIDSASYNILEMNLKKPFMIV
jgi:hypothetical protein